MIYFHPAIKPTYLASVDAGIPSKVPQHLDLAIQHVKPLPYLTNVVLKPPRTFAIKAVRSAILLETLADFSMFWLTVLLRCPSAI